MSSYLSRMRNSMCLCVTYFGQDVAFISPDVQSPCTRSAVCTNLLSAGLDGKLLQGWFRWQQPTVRQRESHLRVTWPALLYRLGATPAVGPAFTIAAKSQVTHTCFCTGSAMDPATAVAFAAALQDHLLAAAPGQAGAAVMTVKPKGRKRKPAQGVCEEPAVTVRPCLFLQVFACRPSPLACLPACLPACLAA